MLPLLASETTHNHINFCSTHKPPADKGFSIMASRTNKAVLSGLAVLSLPTFRVDVSQLHCVMQSPAIIVQSLSPTIH